MSKFSRRSDSQPLSRKIRGFRVSGLGGLPGTLRMRCMGIFRLHVGEYVRSSKVEPQSCYLDPKSM